MQKTYVLSTELLSVLYIYTHTSGIAADTLINSVLKKYFFHHDS